MYMIWLVIVWNGQQRPLAFPAFLVLTGEAIPTTAATARVVAITTVRLTATATFPSGHFYTCRTEC